MCWPYRYRWLPALAVLAALVLVSPAIFGQTPAESSPQAPTQIAPQAPAVAPALVPDQVPAVAAQAQPAAVVPAIPPTPEELGDSLMTHQRYQAAIEAYKKAPHNSAEVWNKLGIAYQLMFNLEEAAHCYQASLRLKPKNSQVLNNLGTVYDAQKEYGDAERMYRKALKADPSSALIYKNFGTNLLTQHKYKKGWEMYKAALAIDPHIFQNSAGPRVQNPSTVEERGALNYYMARGCVRAGMNDSAIEYLRMALNEGFTSPKKIEADSEFAGLRGIPAFQQLLASQKQQ